MAILQKTPTLLHNATTQRWQSYGLIDGLWELDWSTGQFFCSYDCARLLQLEEGSSQLRPAEHEGLIQRDFKDLWYHINFHHRWELLKLSRAHVMDHLLDHPINGVVQYQAPKHLPVWLQWKAYVEYDVFGNVHLLTGSLYDVSTFVQSQLETQQVLAELEKRNELRNRFLSTATHEIKTPLSTILTSTDLIDYQLISSKHPDPEPIRKHLHRIQHQVRKMNGMLDSILILGKLKSNPFPLRPRWVRMASLLDQLQDPVEYACDDQRTLRLENEIPAESLYIDLSLIRPVLINLLSNAYKYSVGGSAPILRFLRQANTLVIEIQDFGIGISEQESADIFDTFYRSASVGHIRGYGVGLSIVKEMIHLHKGHIQVDSRLGEGSIFRIFLPDSFSKPS